MSDNLPRPAYDTAAKSSAGTSASGQSNNEWNREQDKAALFGVPSGATNLNRRLASIGADELTSQQALNNYVGPAREVIVGDDTLRLQDGATPGGIRLAREDRTLTATLAAVGRRRPRSTVNKIGERASVLDYIDSQFHAAIKARTSSQDVGPDILKAIQDAEDGNGAVIDVPAGEYLTSIGLYNGNGTNATGSTKSGVLLAGETCRFYGLGGTSIKAIAAMPTLYEMRGPIDGGGFKNIRWDCNALAERGFGGLAVSSAEFTQFVITQFLRRGFEMLGRGPNGSAGWCANNDTRGFFITSTVVLDGARAFRLSGDITNVLDPHRNTFSLGIVQIPRGQTLPNYAAEYAFCDSNTFTEIDYSVYGPGLGAALLRSNGDNTAFPYPQHNKHIGCSIPSIERQGTVGIDELYAHPTADGEAIPDDPTIIGATDQGESFSDIRVRKTLPKLDLSTPDGLKKLRLQFNANNSGYFGSSIERTADGVNFVKILGFDINEFINSLNGFSTDIIIQKAIGTITFKVPNSSSMYRIQHNASNSSNLGFFIQNSADGVTWTSLFRIGSDGLTAVLFAGVGLRTLNAGAAGSGGTGQRTVTIDN